MKDLTKGYPAKVIILFAIPMIFGSIFQQLYNIADSKIVSTFVGTEAFAAVGATSVVSNTLIGFLNSLTLGFAIPIANSFGGKDYKRMRRMVAGTVLLTLAGAVVLTVLILLLIPAILKLLATPEDIMSPALAYVRIILYGIIFVSVYNMCANVLRAVGDAALLSDYFRVREYWTGSAVCEWISYGDSGCCLGDNHLAGTFGSALSWLYPA